MSGNNISNIGGLEQRGENEALLGDGTCASISGGGGTGNYIGNSGDHKAGGNLIMNGHAIREVGNLTFNKVKGDVNGDRVINMTHALQLAFEDGPCGPKSPDLKICDINRNGKVMVTDATALIAAIRGDANFLSFAGKAIMRPYPYLESRYNPDGIRVKGRLDVSGNVTLDGPGAKSISGVEVYEMEKSSSIPDCNSLREGNIRYTV